MPDLGIGEILIIAVVVMLLFGFKKLPDASRSIGRSLRIFKAETKGLREDDDKPGAPPAKADYTPVPDDEPSALPARSTTVEEQRREAQRFLDATAQQGSGPPAPPGPVVPPAPPGPVVPPAPPGPVVPPAPPGPVVPPAQFTAPQTPTADSSSRPH